MFALSQALEIFNIVAILMLGTSPTIFTVHLLSSRRYKQRTRCFVYAPLAVHITQILSTTPRPNDMSERLPLHLDVQSVSCVVGALGLRRDAVVRKSRDPRSR